MSEVLGIRCTLKKWKDYAVIVPASKSDALNLSIFTDKVENLYLNATFKPQRATKTYSQLKTAWALVTIFFQSEYGRKPTEREREKFHLALLDEYADESMREPDLLNPDKKVPITFRDMSVKQLSNFINIMIQLLAESCSLSTDDQIQAQDVFKEWQNFMSEQDRDWNDYDSDGNLLEFPEWREIHTVSFASGIGGPLDLAHIVSRGTDAKDRFAAWNVMMLTHEEHMDQHKIGWDEFCKKYPHLKGRVKRAERFSGHKLLKEE